MTSLRRSRWLRVAVVAAAVYALPYAYPNEFFVHSLQTAAFTYIVIAGLNLLVGYSGQLSLGTAGFYAIGAYTSAILATRFGAPFWAGAPLGALLAALAGSLVGLLALRARGPYLAMVTIAFGIIVEVIANEWLPVTRGTAGLPNIPRPSLFGLRFGVVEYYYLVGFVAVLVWVAAENLVNSRFGRTLRALAQSEVAAEVAGINVRGWKLLIFSVSSFFAGLGGAFFAHQNGYINSDSFTFDVSVSMLVGVIAGGAGTQLGPLLGVVIVSFVPKFFAQLYDYHLMIFGGILLATLLLLPEGIAGALLRLRPAAAAPGAGGAGAGRGEGAGKGILLPAGAAAPVRDHVLLEAQGLEMDFGGLRAVAGVDLQVQAHSVHGLIGPNGSGKSTLVNLLSGVYRPTAGTIRWQGRDVTGLSPHAMARLGVTRTFQNLQLFGEQTVLENVLVGYHRHFRHGLLHFLTASPAQHREEAEFTARAMGLLELVGLADKAQLPAKSLPYGQQRLVEIARAVAAAPQLLILDEPAAGCGPGEIEEVMRVVRRLHEAGLTILIVEHHMELIMGLCDRVTVLDFGTRIAEGDPAAIRQDPQVIAAYLGGEEVAALVGGHGA